MSNPAVPKKVLIILAHTGGGGDTQVILNLLHALPAHSFEFHILSYEQGELHDEFGAFGRLYTFPIDTTRWLRRLLRRFFLPLFVFLKKAYARQLIRKVNPDLLYVNTVNEHEFSKEAVRSGRKLIVHIHEMGYVVTQRKQMQWVDTLLAKAYLIISPAKAVSDFYRDVFGIDAGRMRVVHETVADSRLATRRTAGSLRQTLNLPQGTLLIGGAGSVIYRKGVDTFLRTCALLKVSHPHLRFHFVWLGGSSGTSLPYPRALQQTLAREDLADDFRFLPHTPQVGNFYADLDIFVLPSRMEAFPLVVLEALLAQKPVVAMDVAGVREVIDHTTGYLVKDRTPEGLAEGILYFMESDERRREAGRKGRERVLQKYEAQVQALKWFDLINNL
jgi:glycosyltransferase involved in cell wall biosynthesis